MDQQDPGPQNNVPQPNLGNIATALNVVAHQFNVVAHETALVPNLPAAQTQAILVAINRLDNTISRLENRQANSEIAIINARLLDSNFEKVLQPLLNVHTGEPIANFPHRLADVRNLDQAAVDAILVQLRITVPGLPLEAKKETIRKKWIMR